MNEPKPQEFIVIHRQEETPSKKSVIDVFEKYARILSLIAIPLVLGIVGYWVQKSLGDKNLNREYVELAVGILTEEEKEIPDEIRTWAVDMLNENSPTKFDKQTIERLKTGEISLQSILKDISLNGCANGGFSISPDGQNLVTGHEDGSIKLWGATTGKLLINFNIHEDAVTGLTFSPDGKYILSGSLDGTAKLSDIQDGVLLMSLQGHTAGVIGVSFSPDGRGITTRSLDNTIKTWSIDGKILQSIKLKN